MWRRLRSPRVRLGLQLGLLAGVGLAFALSVREPANAGGMDCPQEGACTFKKPNVMFVLDYSTSMNTIWDEVDELTRWDVAVAAIADVTVPGSFLSQTTHLALMRFGHDPDADSPGTPIPGDDSGLVDGQALDLAWDDDNGVYDGCAGDILADILGSTPAPMNGSPFGIGTWTKGALDAVAVEIAATALDHPDDVLDPARRHMIIVITDSAWTGADGTTFLQPPSQDPTSTATALFDEQNIPTYVVTLDADAQGEAAADELAAAGGTVEAIHADTPGQLSEAMAALVTILVETIEADVSECEPRLPRVMILLDGSSSMLNLGEPPNEFAAAMGEGRWDLARDALAGNNSIFDADHGEALVEDVMHLGLAVFGEPDEAKILVQYGPCTQEDFAFALDPLSSCEQPGCDDPWAGPPITWTFQADPTPSHMPQCVDGDGDGCAGSGRALHAGLQLLAANQGEYQLASLDPMALHPTTAQTVYRNVLILGGRYDGYSSDAQVQAPLEAMASAGIETRVIGFGLDLDDPSTVAQLQSLASWGSGGVEAPLVAASQAELEVALAGVLQAVEVDPCCAFADCSGIVKPTTLEPDPTPQDEGDGDGDGDSGDGDGDSGDGDSDGETSTSGSDTSTSGGESSTSDSGGDSGDTGSSETGDGPSALSGRGCACDLGSTPNPRVPLGWLLGLGLGLARLRRGRSR